MQEKYDRIGTQYNQTRKADPFLFSQMEKLLAPGHGNKYLDIGCGTGNYTIEFAKKGYDFIGVEPSEKMLETARVRHQGISWKKGRAESIPLDDESVDGVLASLTLHHWKDLGQGMKEVYRVLKPHSHYVIFTSDPDQMRGYWLNHYFPEMLQKSISQMPDMDLVRASLSKAGFTISEEIPYYIKDDLQDHFLYVGKNRPQLYLDTAIRKGISSFSDLSLENEVNNGLRELERDLSSGKIQEIMESFRNEMGDYVFLKMKK